MTRTEASVVSVLTPPGPAAIAAVRLRGPRTRAFIERHVRLSRGSWPDVPVGAVRRAALLDADGEPIDDVLVWLVAREPVCDVVVYLHGSPVLVDLCGELAESGGFIASDAPPADLWRPRNRFEAAGWAALPAMQTEAGVRWLLTQIERLPAALRRLAGEPDKRRLRDELHAMADRAVIAQWFAKPLRVVVVGPPNAGKSTLINAVSGRSVSLVSHVPGTTRDFLETRTEHAGFPVVWVDTAGLRRSEDPLETAGMRQTRRVLTAAAVVVCVLDASVGSGGPDPHVRGLLRSGRPIVVALNKCDLPNEAAAWRRELSEMPAGRVCELSARRGQGLETLVSAVLEAGRRAGVDLHAPAAYTAELARWLRELAAGEHPAAGLQRADWPI